MVRNARGAKFRVRTNECVELRPASSSSRDSSSNISEISSLKSSSATGSSTDGREETVVLSLSISKEQEELLRCFDGEEAVDREAKPTPSSSSCMSSPRGASVVEIVGLDGIIERVCSSQVDAAKYLEVRGTVRKNQCEG